MADGAIHARRARTSADSASAAATAGSADRIVFLGHATTLIEVGDVRLLTDPLLRGRVAHLRRQVSPVDPGMWTGIDAVLISHLHQDHLDLPSLRLLGRDTLLLVPSGAGAWLRGHGFAQVSELNVGETVSFGELSVTAVRASHDGRRRVGPGSLSAATLGYVVRGRSTVYFAGDTELFDGMSDLLSRDGIDHRADPSLRRHGIEGRADTSPRLDVALLPVAGWGPTLGPGHMGPLDAARAAGLLRPRIAIPIHWGTLSPIGVARRYRERRAEPPRMFAEHVERVAPGVEVRVLEPGQETTF